MKVLSIKQPWASLIINGYKHYEFRSWNTKYRGKVLIHASKSIDKKVIDRFNSLSLDYPTGCIIGSVDITDCIKVDNVFENDLIKENNLVYGATKDRFGYAFKLENIKRFNKYIDINGKLGFWNYYEENEIMNMMSEIEYGWLDKNNKVNIQTYDNFADNYILQTPNQVIDNKIGVCWDQVELERFYFKNSNLNIETYFLCHYDNDKCPTHTFLTFKKNNRYYWFEHSWKKFRGIHEYSSLRDLLQDVISKFISDEKIITYNSCDLCLYKYEQPRFGMTVKEFYNHCENSINIDIDNLGELES